ncbi:MAG: 3-isopropylmalate dehydratase small subunit [Acidobacteria bacterium]|nr:3-isopropylmalate dehydratase small subunit [Acidobacteriota bacterium]
MERFESLTGIAAPLLQANVDTDLIIPKQFLTTLVRSGLGRHLFFEIRYDRGGLELPEFVLNREPFRKASILLAGPNFGCGSSREHAPWALRDFGIRCIIAPSFADIFFNNCFANGILPIPLSLPDVEALAEIEGPLTVDLAAQIVSGAGRIWRFEMDPGRKATLLEGLDEIGRTERSLPAIEAWETGREGQRPWL